MATTWDSLDYNLRRKVLFELDAIASKYRNDADRCRAISERGDSSTAYYSEKIQDDNHLAEAVEALIDKLFPNVGGM